MKQTGGNDYELFFACEDAICSLQLHLGNWVHATEHATQMMMLDPYHPAGYISFVQAMKMLELDPAEMAVQFYYHALRKIKPGSADYRLILSLRDA